MKEDIPHWQTLTLILVIIVAAVGLGHTAAGVISRDIPRLESELETAYEQPVAGPDVIPPSGPIRAVLKAQIEYIALLERLVELQQTEIKLLKQ